jgi:5-methyltetrahydrofolate--homocysteine methyltransferase
MMMEGAGFEIIDLGTDVAPQRFVDEAREQKANIIAMSALLTTTMLNMQTVIQALQESGIRDSVKVMVGGAPVTKEFAAQIGADGYAPDASQAARVALSYFS